MFYGGKKEPNLSSQDFHLVENGSCFPNGVEDLRFSFLVFIVCSEIMGRFLLKETKSILQNNGNNSRGEVNDRQHKSCNLISTKVGVHFSRL